LYYLCLLKSYYLNGQARFYAILRKDGNFSMESTWIAGWTAADFKNKYDNELKPQGWSIHSVDTYMIGSQRRYSAVFWRTYEDTYWVGGWTQDDFKGKYDSLKSQGWRLASLHTYNDNGSSRYTAFSEKGAWAEFWAGCFTYDDFITIYNSKANAGMRLHSFDTFPLDGVRYYTGLWTSESSNGEAWLGGWDFGDFWSDYLTNRVPAFPPVPGFEPEWRIKDFNVSE
jgi:hypothetical protein